MKDKADKPLDVYTEDHMTTTTFTDQRTLERAIYDKHGTDINKFFSEGVTYHHFDGTPSYHRITEYHRYLDEAWHHVGTWEKKKGTMHPSPTEALTKLEYGHEL